MYQLQQMINRKARLERLQQVFLDLLKAMLPMEIISSSKQVYSTTLICLMSSIRKSSSSSRQKASLITTNLNNTLLVRYPLCSLQIDCHSSIRFRIATSSFSFIFFRSLPVTGFFGTMLSLKISSMDLRSQVSPSEATTGSSMSCREMGHLISQGKGCMQIYNQRKPQSLQCKLPRINQLMLKENISEDFKFLFLFAKELASNCIDVNYHALTALQLQLPSLSDHTVVANILIKVFIKFEQTRIFQLKQRIIRVCRASSQKYMPMVSKQHQKFLQIFVSLIESKDQTNLIYNLQLARHNIELLLNSNDLYRTVIAHYKRTNNLRLKQEAWLFLVLGAQKSIMMKMIAEKQKLIFEPAQTLTAIQKVRLLLKSTEDFKTKFRLEQDLAFLEFMQNIINLTDQDLAVQGQKLLHVLNLKLRMRGQQPRVQLGEGQFQAQQQLSNMCLLKSSSLRELMLKKQSVIQSIYI